MELYIFYGEEDFLREYNANKVIGECNLSNPSMNFVKLDDETISKIIGLSLKEIVKLQTNN